MLTKFSEIEGGELQCRLPDGHRVPAELIGSDAKSDLAMLKIEADNLVALEWAEQSEPVVGSWLATVSQAPLPAAVGVVSVVPRKIARPGGLLGVVLEDGDDGPLVVRVMADSAAEKSRVFVNDVIKQLNGKAVRNRQMLINMLRRMKAGTDVKLTVARADEEHELEATLGARGSFQDALGSDLSGRRGGFASAMQHDTVLDANQCGGPVVGLDGRAVGLNIARAGRVVSYALPAAAIRPVIADLLPGNVEEKTSLTDQNDNE